MSLVVQTLSEQIFTLVRDRIITGKIAANAAVKQDALAAELGCSKIPLREAFVRLEQEGLLVSQANRGYFVKPMTADEVEEIYALRLKLEPDAVAKAALYADEAQRLAAKDALAALDAANGQGVHEVGKLNRLFHLSLVLPQDALTYQILERLNVMSERYVSRHLEPPGREDNAHIEHVKLLDAWLSGNDKLAASLCHTHLIGSLSDLRREFVTSAVA